MKFSTRSRYGTRAMLDLALHDNSSPVRLKDLARRQGVSVKYLEQIIPALKNAGFIRSIRGINGGYTLAKGAGEIRLLDIVEALEGSLSPVDCVDMPKWCPRSGECATHEVWRDVRKAIDDVLGGTTLADLAERQRALSEPR
ncbi:MAG: Rrf2 family transcriptional regulator [Candidatus Aquicultor sp.]|nr:Rrf2 family transcriptional regulator [Candidatus Aquicultor sp.]